MNCLHPTSVRRTRRSSAIVTVVAAAIVATALSLASVSAFAQQVAPPMPSDAAQPLPTWEQLTPAQREMLIATLRDRWNQSPQQRARIMNHAQRWKQMTPEQRQRAQAGKHRWDKMTPQQRAQARAAFEQGKTLSPEQRAALREKLKAMSPEQRREWLKQYRGQRQGPQRRSMQGRDQQAPNPPPVQESRP
jgi:Protein of unknown function (DUF3106)